MNALMIIILGIAALVGLYIKMWLGLTGSGTKEVKPCNCMTQKRKRNCHISVSKKSLRKPGKKR